jgi:hypothetical protein
LHPSFDVRAAEPLLNLAVVEPEVDPDLRGLARGGGGDPRPTSPDSREGSGSGSAAPAGGPLRPPPPSAVVVACSRHAREEAHTRGRGSAGEPDGEGEGGRAVEACAARWRGEERREAGFGCDGVLVEAKPRLGSCVMERRRRCRSGERIEREGRGRWGKLESMTNGPCSG